MRADMEAAFKPLMDGIPCKKHGRNGRSKTNKVNLSKDMSIFTWSSTKKEEGIRVADITSVLSGQSTTVLKSSGKAGNAELYLSLVAGDRTLDIEVGTTAKRDEIVSLIEQLLFYTARKNVDGSIDVAEIDDDSNHVVSEAALNYVVENNGEVEGLAGGVAKGVGVAAAAAGAQAQEGGRLLVVLDVDAAGYSQKTEEALRRAMDAMPTDEGRAQAVCLLNGLAANSKLDNKQMYQAALEIQATVANVEVDGDAAITAVAGAVQGAASLAPEVCDAVKHTLVNVLLYSRGDGAAGLVCKEAHS